MRRASTVDVDRNEAGVLQCIVLAGGACAEHEIGIDELLAAAGIPAYDPGSTTGIEGRSVSSPLAKIAFEERMSSVIVGDESRSRRMPFAVLSFGHLDDDHARRRASHPRKWFRNENQIEGDWSKSGFSLEAVGEANVSILRTLAEGARIGDLAIWYGTISRNPFARPSLMIARPSLVDHEKIEQMRENDLIRQAHLRGESLTISL